MHFILWIICTGTRSLSYCNGKKCMCNTYTQSRKTCATQDITFRSSFLSYTDDKQISMETFVSTHVSHGEQLIIIWLTAADFCQIRSLPYPGAVPADDQRYRYAFYSRCKTGMLFNRFHFPLRVWLNHTKLTTRQSLKAHPTFQI